VDYTNFWCGESIMKKKRVDALTIPSEPTISGEISPNGINAVGGNVV
jgi:hypothetical protein